MSLHNTKNSNEGVNMRRVIETPNPDGLPAGTDIIQRKHATGIETGQYGYGVRDEVRF